jgi:hypothetical protein
MLSPLAASADPWNNGWNRDGGRYYQRHDGGIQAQKNTDRNIAIGCAALGVIGLANHNNTEAILGAAGAIIAGSQAQRDQHIENQRHNWFYHRF